MVVAWVLLNDYLLSIFDELTAANRTSLEGKKLFGGYTSTRPAMMSRYLVAGFREHIYSAEVW